MDVLLQRIKSQNNDLHEGVLCIAYNDYDSSFDALLEKDDSLVIHQRNLCFLSIEMHRIHSKISPAFICDLISEAALYKIIENRDAI